MAAKQRTQMTVPAHDVRVDDLHIAMEGPGRPVGKGARWLRVAQVLPVNGSVLIGWESSHRWYLTGDMVNIKRVQPAA